MQRLTRYFLALLLALLSFAALWAQEKLGTATRPIRLGVMLPLNDQSTDGKNMVEYYRGVLMACDSLKKLGVSVDIHAWNVTEFSVVSKILDQKEATQLDLLIGPVYATKVQQLSDFAVRNNIMMMLPFAVDASDVSVNPRLFQVFQNNTDRSNLLSQRVFSQFKNYHPVIIDCADAESNKGAFTAKLRELFGNNKVKYSLTSLASPVNKFVKAFEKDKPNLVVLNSARPSYLQQVFERLEQVKRDRPSAAITLLGYEEWQQDVQALSSQLHHFDTYLATSHYANMSPAAVQRLQQKYRWNFHLDMQGGEPRFALTGFDHTFFFLRGLYKYGVTFDGAEGRFGYPPVQTPLAFSRVGNGGFKNQAGLFIHFTQTGRVEVIKY